MAGGPDGLQLLTGASKTNMNLAVLRQHIEDVHKTIDQLLKTLQFQPEKVQWSQMLDQFSVANIQLAKVKQQLRPMLKHYAIHPKMLTQANANVVHLLLATKLLPEMEEEEAAMLQEQRAREEDAPVEGGQYLILQGQVDNLNRIVSFLTVRAPEELEPLSGLLDQRGPIRQRMADTSRKLLRLIERTREKQQIPKGGRVVGQRRPQARGSLRANETRSRSDLLLSAVLTGEGLHED